MLSYETLLGVALLLPQAFALLRVPVGPNGDFKRLAKKDTVNLYTTIQTYIIPGSKFYFGSQHEEVFVSFDTGSYTSYVQDSSISSNGFDGNVSTSLVLFNKDYSVNYADGTSFNGKWVADYVAFDDTYSQSANLSFGLVTEASDDTNIFGLGYYPDSTDPMFVDTLYEDGVISKKVFSVYQNSISSGEFNFGGIDTAKFSGDLTAVPVIADQAWDIKLFDFYHGCETLTYGNSYQMLVDSGSSTGIYLPEGIYNALMQKLDAKYESTLKNYIFDCSNAESLTFDLGGIQIEIPTSLFVQKVTGTDYCAVNWRVNSNSEFQLGWTFFSSFYFVFDADNKEILIGSPNKSTTEESVVEITDAVPSSTKAASYSETELVTSNTISQSSIPTVSLFASSSSLGDYYTGSTGYTTCSASSSSSSLSSSSASSSPIPSSASIASSSSISSSSVLSSSGVALSSASISSSSSSSTPISSSPISSSASFSSAEPSSTESSSSSVELSSSIESSSSSVEPSSSIESSSSSVEPSSSIESSSSSVESSSSIELSFSSVKLSGSSIGSTSSVETRSSPVISSEPSLAPEVSSSSFSTITPSVVPSLTAVSSPSSSLELSSFSGYFNSSSPVSSTATSSALPSSTETPSINGSFIGTAPVWDAYIPGGLGPWSQVEIYTSSASEVRYSQVQLFVGNNRVTPSVYQQNGDSFQYNYAEEIPVDGILRAHIIADSYSGKTATIEITIAVTENVAGSGLTLKKRAVKTFTLTSTITVSAASSSSSTLASTVASSTVAPSSITSITSSGSTSIVIPSTSSLFESSTTPVSSKLTASESTTSASAATLSESDVLSTSTAVVEPQETTVVTITSCSNNVCTEQPTTVAVQTVTKTLGNIIQLYTTYCPLTAEGSAMESSAKATESTTEVTPATFVATTAEHQSSSESVESTSTEIIFVTSTLPNGQVSTVAFTKVSTPSYSSKAAISSASAPVSTELVPTSTQGDSTLYVTYLITETTNTASSGASSSVPTLLTQGSLSSSSNGTYSPIQVSEYEGSGSRLVAGMLSALPIIMMLF